MNKCAPILIHYEDGNILKSSLARPRGIKNKVSQSIARKGACFIFRNYKEKLF